MRLMIEFEGSKEMANINQGKIIGKVLSNSSSLSDKPFVPIVAKFLNISIFFNAARVISRLYSLTSFAFSAQR